MANHSGDNDVVDELLDFYGEETKVNDSDDLQNALRLTRDNIKAIIMDVMFGGTETVASALEWAMAELMKSPEDLKRAAEDATINDHYIPAKSRVIVNAWAIGRDKNSCEDPEDFIPSRFLKEGVADFKGGNFEFLPFGSGRRSCPGLYAFEMALAHFLHCFNWELPHGMKPSDVDMDDVFGLTAPKATRLVAVPTPRLFCPLY
ncbi:Cytochrome 84A1 [Capsicum baccatum]|uniref:Cytochrome 84A1 n=1 Tax=Capsicum baccatum TaxID=33114 RepID=A0A2G2WX68_CAPBA|nr:Cytochrome 84A1 [Capsicum baccatum]